MAGKMEKLLREFGGGQDYEDCVDGYPLFANDPYRNEMFEVNRFLGILHDKLGLSPSIEVMESKGPAIVDEFFRSLDRGNAISLLESIGEWDRDVAIMESFIPHGIEKGIDKPKDPAANICQAALRRLIWNSQGKHSNPPRVRALSMLMEKILASDNYFTDNGLANMLASIVSLCEDVRAIPLEAIFAFIEKVKLDKTMGGYRTNQHLAELKKSDPVKKVPGLGEKIRKLIMVFPKNEGKDIPDQWYDTIFSWVKKPPQQRGSDGYPICDGDPYPGHQSLLTDYLKECIDKADIKYNELYVFDLDRFDSFKKVKKMGKKELAELCLAIYYRQIWNSAKMLWFSIVTEALEKLLTIVLELKPEFKIDHICKIIEILLNGGPKPSRELITEFIFPECRTILNSDDSEAIKKIKASLLTLYNSDVNLEDGQSGDLINLIGEEVPMEGLWVKEPWAKEIVNFTTALDKDKRSAWSEIIKHFKEGGSKSKPSKNWLKETLDLIDRVGRDKYKNWALNLVKIIEKPPFPECAHYVDDRSATNKFVLTSFVWSLSLLEDPEVSRTVGDLALACYRKIPGWGQRYKMSGNACLKVLSGLPGKEAVVQMGRIKNKVKLPSTRKLIEKAFNEAAKKAGVSAEELEEMAVPTFGLNDEGFIEEEMGDYKAVLTVTGISGTDLKWIKPDGKSQTSIPASVKSDHPEELKSLKKAADEIKKILPAQRNRIESLLMAERSWTMKDWRDRYIDHPLLLHLTRKLIWHFTDGDKKELGAWLNGKIVDVNDRSIEWLTDRAEVRLWHPIGFEPEVVIGWRRWLVAHKITQPFKQAHREIYILTDAELETETYSNRFAGHFLKQHQFNALCGERGWRYRLMGSFDGHNTPTLEIPHWNMNVEYWVDMIDEHWDDQSAQSDSGIFLYISTDQVRFVRPDGETIPLSEVPALVFTEVMRDVDLFVGVCSVGNDPTWRDQGEAGAQHDYWIDFAFGELSTSARTRKDVLADLIPKLKIADRCEIDGKFLLVKGDMNTYKIHMGSGNVMISPTDRYVCIVRDRGKSLKSGTGDIFLPFEGDGMLSVIISKAFMLADDTKIKDESILRQIKR